MYQAALSSGCFKKIDVIAAGVEQVITRNGYLCTERRQINIHQLARTFTKLAGHHHGIHIRPLYRLHDGTNDVGYRENSGSAGANHNNVGLLAWRKGANLVLQTGRTRAINRCRFQDVLGRDG